MPHSFVEGINDGVQQPEGRRRRRITRSSPRPPPMPAEAQGRIHGRATEHPFAPLALALLMVALDVIQAGAVLVFKTGSRRPGTSV